MQERWNLIAPEGCVAVWPIRADGTEGNWQISTENLRASIEIGYAKLGNWRGENTAITYLAKGEREKISKGAFTIIGHRQDGSIITDDDAYIPKFIDMQNQTTGVRAYRRITPFRLHLTSGDRYSI